jgi:prevent-host-death family protein
VDVAISELRSNLRAWVDHARSGDDVVVTERGVPVARLVAVEASGVIERLERDGLITRPRSASRPRATGRHRVHASEPVSELVAESRR